MSSMLWTNCLQKLEQELSDQQLNTWIRPLQVDEVDNRLVLFAPNRFVLDWVKQNFFEKIHATLNAVNQGEEVSLSLEIGSQQVKTAKKPVNKPASNSKPKNTAVFVAPEVIPNIENNVFCWCTFFFFKHQLTPHLIKYDFLIKRM